MLLYVHESLSFSERNDLLVANSLEMLSIEIVKPHNKSFLVSTWYRPPKLDDCLFNDFETFLRKCDIEHLEVILIGDLNCDMLKHPQEAHTRKLNFLSSLYQHKQLINKPTRVTGTSATLIDLILTNNEENIFKSGAIHLGISDHSLIFTIRKYCAPKSEQSIRQVRNFKRFNAINFLNDLSQMPWENVGLYNDPNDCWRVWKTLFLHVLDWHAPLKMVRLRGNTIPWDTSNIKKLMRSRDFYKKQATKHNSQIYWDNFKKLCIKVNSELAKAKRELSFLYVCMVNTIYLLSFVETPRKFIIAELLIRKLGSSSVL